MTDPEDRSQRGTQGLGILLGTVLTPLLWYAGASIGGVPILVLAAAAVVGAMVGIARGQGFARGLGIGVLVGFAVILLLFGAIWVACMGAENR